MSVRCFYSGLVWGSGPIVARVALLACIGGLEFVVCAFGGFLLWLLPAYVFLTIASLCNISVLPSMGRVALLACVGGLAFVVCAFGGFLP